MKLQIGHWWTMDKRGETEAHVVAVVKPDLITPTSVLDFVTSEWSPACSAANVSASRLVWSATLYSTFKSAGDRPPHHCLRCEDLVGAVRALAGGDVA